MRCIRLGICIGSTSGSTESEHGLQLLLAKMPDMDARAFSEMSADMVAELLLYLIAKGVVTLPIPSEKALLDMPWGSHVCQFYNGKEDLPEMLVPYFKQGLERNEACVWLVGDLTVEEVRRTAVGSKSVGHHRRPHFERGIARLQPQALRATRAGRRRRSDEARHRKIAAGGRRHGRSAPDRDEPG